MRGRFPYNVDAVVSDRGQRRKERFVSRAFRHTVEDADQPVDILVGHEFGKPLARRQAGHVRLQDTDDALLFEADLPELDDAPSWVVDAVRAIDSNLMENLSPGFRVPPPSIVPGAERIVPEAGNPGVMVREIHEAVLREMSVVTNPAYRQSAVELRAELANRLPADDWRRWALWL